MTRSHVQLCTRFNKIDHIYFFFDAVRRKDYLNICRHFLWYINRPNNKPYTPKSIVSTIASLTEKFGIDKRRIENVLSQMGKSGEIERYKGIHNRVGWNPDVTNREKWTHFTSNYSGNHVFRYTDDELATKEAMEKLTSNSNMPVDLEDLQHTNDVEDYDMLMEKIKNLENEIADLKKFKVFCQEKFKADEIKEWFREHGLVDMSAKEEFAT